MKNIWIFNHYATKPDEPKTRAYDIGKELAKKGHKMTIFASSFSHYQLKEKYLFGKEKYRIENLNGIRFVWIKTFPYKKNDWRRVLSMLSFSWRVFMISQKMEDKPDIIIGTCVHPFAVLSAYLVSKIKKSRFFFEVTDLWPQSMIDVGNFSSINPGILALRVLEKFLFNKAEKIIIIPPGTKEYIISRGILEEKIVWIPNAVDLSFYKNVKPYNGGASVFMYSGIFAKYSGLDVIIKSAKILEDKNINARFVLVGGGAEKENLEKLAESMDIGNLEFYGMVPKNEIAKVYEKADVFISIIKNVVSSSGVSSKKLNEYMACGRPIIFAVNSINNPVEEAKAGVTIPAENPEALAKAVEKMTNLSREERLKMAENAKEYARNNLDIKIMAEKLEKLF
jgi:glycosyltransferase involved in cell wall biosynthesis